MRNLLTTTAFAVAMALATSAFAHESYNVVLNGQLNLDSPVVAVGVVTLNADVKIGGDLNVLAVGNSNETTAVAGGSTFTMSDHEGSRFSASYEREHHETEVRFSHVSWDNFDMSRSETNPVFVANLQANIDSPVVAVGVAALGHSADVSVRGNVTVQAVGNANVTTLTH